MNQRLLALTGPLFTVIFYVLAFSMSDGPGEGASGKAVVAFINDHDGQLMTGAFAGPALAALLLLFFSHLRALARGRLGDAGAGPTVMVGGAVLWAGGLLLGSMLDLAAYSAGDHDLEQVAQTINVLVETSWLPFIAGIAVMLIGAGMTVLRTGLLPRWLGWIALVIGVVALAGPGGFAGFFVGPIWMLVAGIMLFMPRTTDDPVVAA